MSYRQVWHTCYISSDAHASEGLNTGVQNADAIWSEAGWGGRQLHRPLSPGKSFLKGGLIGFCCFFITDFEPRMMVFIASAQPSDFVICSFFFSFFAGWSGDDSNGVVLLFFKTEKGSSWNTILHTELDRSDRTERPACDRSHHHNRTAAVHVLLRTDANRPLVETCSDSSSSLPSQPREGQALHLEQCGGYGTNAGGRMYLGDVADAQQQ
jgi:hypothetical protein